MQQKRSFIKRIQLLGIIFLTGIGFSIVALNLFNSSQELNNRTKEMREEFVQHQKERIKYEVKRAVDMINYEQNRALSLAKKTVKSRVYQACEISINIHKHYEKTKSLAEIQEIIIETLRAMRFDDGNGYFFICQTNDISILQPSLSEMEGHHFNDIKNPEKQETLKKISAIAIDSGEGFSEYQWNKLHERKTAKQKITFVKLFPIYNWVIGSGIYLEDIEKPLKAEVLKRISKIRFGKEGYIFINRLNGDALVSNGELYSGNKKLWEIFYKEAEKIRKLFTMEYYAALKPEGDYIYYSWIKLTDPNTESPKTSFIQGIPKLQWLVGAGVYLDDLEDEITLMQDNFKSKATEKTIYSALLIFVVLLLFLLLLNRLTRRLKTDFNLFISFFDKAAQSGKMINRNKIKLVEFEHMADNANQMLKKIQQAEKELFENEQRLRTLINSSPDIICFKDGDGRWLEANNAELELFSLTNVDYRGKTDSELAKFTNPIYKEAFLSYQSSDEKAWQAKGISRNEETLPQPDGSQKIFDIIKVSIFQKDGDRKGLVVLGRNVTEQKQAEAELQKMEKLKSIGTLAGGIAHDFNNILMGLFGNIAIAKEYLESNNPAFYALEKAEKSMSRATNLSTQLLTFAKGGAPVKENVSLTELVDEVVKFDLSGSKIKPIFEKSANLWLADVDKGQMQQVFSNLTINAKQAMPSGGNLYITIENCKVSNAMLPGLKSGNYIKIMMQDQGIGIDKEHLKQIFDPYFSTKQAGSGLGLATTYSIIKRHGGHIKAESELGRGSIFTIFLPASENTNLTPTEKPSTPLSTQGKGLKVLVMDDEEVIREVTLQMLKKNDYKTVVVENGRQAIEKYKQALDAGEPFDIAIMDLTIPGGMGGQEAIKDILALDPQAKAIVSSGYADDPVMANFSDYGFMDMIKKPYTINQLLKALHRIMK